jgi:hypothetical protein
MEIFHLKGVSSMNAKVNISNRAGASFPVRRMNFDFDQVPEYWMNGSAGLTHFMTAYLHYFQMVKNYLLISACCTLSPSD